MHRRSNAARFLLRAGKIRAAHTHQAGGRNAQSGMVSVTARRRVLRRARTRLYRCLATDGGVDGVRGGGVPRLVAGGSAGDRQLLVQLGRSRAVPLHSDRDVPPPRPQDRGHERGAAGRRPRSALKGAERGRLQDRGRCHRAGGDSRHVRNERPHGAQPRVVLLLGVRQSVAARHVGLARGRASSVAAFHGRQRRDDSQHPGVLRQQSGRGKGRAAQGDAGARDGGGRRPGAAEGAGR